MVAEYPTRSVDRDRWILSHRAPRATVDPFQPQAFLIEEELAHHGAIVPVATIFLTNRECPWRCLMCDLWRHTTTDTVPAGAIPAQIDLALGQLFFAPALGPTRQIKLYNSGSFFDPRAIPPGDYPAIAARLQSFERVIVECHPALVGPTCRAFAELLSCPLEIAMGLETAHPEVLARLNKRMSLEDYQRAAQFLTEHDIALRSFILVQPPFMKETEALMWANRSVDFAAACGATVASLIPTRAGNGAVDTLAAQGQFSPPSLRTLEAAAAYGVAKGSLRVFTDLWDVEKFAACPQCSRSRIERLRTLNLTQTLPAPIQCRFCDSGAARDV